MPMLCSLCTRVGINHMNGTYVPMISVSGVLHAKKNPECSGIALHVKNQVDGHIHVVNFKGMFLYGVLLVGVQRMRCCSPHMFPPYIIECECVNVFLASYCFISQL